ncbi:DUF1273 domain-containing protein [uncultured Limosilactobacillus sp.]|uniref:DUF1273 domain-containing protein n=1 Tax=uncultured Limosilactobacillus sp. TaxID=2837629 RepID=UPI0025F7FBA5|nr:DUF1273 domain-containing protein [uncultured Limosilactobacillus sp.]
MRRIWVTGYRAFELNVFQDNDPKVTVIKEVISKILAEKLNETTDSCWLLTGANLGVDQWAVQAGLALKKDYQQLKIAMMTPYEQFGQRWNENNQAKLAQLRQQVDFASTVTKGPYQTPAQLRAYTDFMVDYSDEAVMIYDPDHKGKPQWDYAAIKQAGEMHDYPLRLVDFDELQTAAEEWGEHQREKAEEDGRFNS